MMGKHNESDPRVTESVFLVVQWQARDTENVTVSEAFRMYRMCRSFLRSGFPWLKSKRRNSESSTEPVRSRITSLLSHSHRYFGIYHSFFLRQEGISKLSTRVLDLSLASTPSSD